MNTTWAAWQWRADIVTFYNTDVILTDGWIPTSEIQQ